MITYTKLWKLLIDKKMKKTDLIKQANISSSTLAKLSKDFPVKIEVIDRICLLLNCKIEDVLEIKKTGK